MSGDGGGGAARRSLWRRDVLGWCAFDFANSSYTTVITTVAFSVYFSQVVVGGRDGRGPWLWAVAGIAVNLALIVTSPILGALADYSGRKKLFLLLTVVQTVVGTALLATLGPGDVVLALVVYVVASIGFEGGYVFYNAFLPEISEPESAGRVSGLAWGMGFIGGLLSLVACGPFIGGTLRDPGTGALDLGAAADYRRAFLLVAVFFAVFSIPTFLFLGEVARQGKAPRPRDYATVGFRRVAETLGHLKRYRESAKFVAAYVFFFGGISAVIRFSAIYASDTFGIRGDELKWLFVFTNVVAVPGTIVAGRLADRLGSKSTLVGTLVLWIGVAVAGWLAQGKLVFWSMAAGAAIGMGSTQAVGRSFMSQLSPRSRESEFFGFYVLAGQVGSILGQATFGGVTALTGSQRLAVLLTVPFFVVGLALTMAIDERRAREDVASTP